MEGRPLGTNPKFADLGCLVWILTIARRLVDTLFLGYLTRAAQEKDIPTTKHDAEVKHHLEIGLPGASSIEDKTIPTFSRGELPHFAGINTFMKAPFVEDVRDVGGYDATVVGVPFDGGCTYRAGKP